MSLRDSSNVESDNAMSGRVTHSNALAVVHVRCVQPTLTNPESLDKWICGGPWEPGGGGAVGILSAVLGRGGDRREKGEAGRANRNV